MRLFGGWEVQFCRKYHFIYIIYTDVSKSESNAQKSMKKNKVNISNRIFEFNWANVVDDGCNDRHLTLIEMIVFYLILIGEIRQERI